MAESSDKPFQPYVAASTILPEFSIRAILLGAVFGIIFGASTVYLALRAGQTVSASIPIAVLAIFILGKLGKASILENNIVQTVGSAGESIAAGVAFTIPAFLFLTGGIEFFNYFNIFTLALVGGILGVLFMVPLRRSLIVKEHATLPYPEGTACAELLIAGEKGGSLASRVFAGLGIGAAYKTLMSIFGLWKDVPGIAAGRGGAFPRASVACEITPEYLGVGYIIGPKIGGVLVAGGVLTYLVLIPLVAYIGDLLTGPVSPGVGNTLIRDMDPDVIRLGYTRYIGAGAVAAGGLLTLLRTIPTIVSAVKDSFKNLEDLKAGKSLLRTERDIPITYVIVGSLILMGIIALLPQLPGTFPGTIFMGLLVVVFGFFFVTVSSRIVGLIGSTSNPISGMTIASLMATCGIFVALGWKGDAYQAMALCVGGIVCIAAANAGNTSQDLKTGHLLGATPISQQLGLIVGVLASVLAVGWTLKLIDSTQQLNGIEHAIGTNAYPAPQATLMATIIRGVLAQDLPWGLVLAGAFISIVVELCGIRSLSFAVGVYLPLSTTLPIFLGGAVRGLVDRASGSASHNESEVSPGMLYSTGLVAGGSLLGVVIAVLQVVEKQTAEGPVRLFDWIINTVGVKGWEHYGGTADVIGALAFCALGFLLYRAARQKLA